MVTGKVPHPRGIEFDPCLGRNWHNLSCSNAKCVPGSLYGYFREYLSAPWSRKLFWLHSCLNDRPYLISPEPLPLPLSNKPQSLCRKRGRGMTGITWKTSQWWSVRAVTHVRNTFKNGIFLQNDPYLLFSILNIRSSAIIYFLVQRNEKWCIKSCYCNQATVLFRSWHWKYDIIFQLTCFGALENIRIRTQNCHLNQG